MNKFPGIVALLIVVIGGWWIMKNGSPAEAKGRVVVAITDAAADMGAVNSISMKVSGVKLHSTTDVWVDVGGSATVDLLQLKASGEFALLVAADVAAGTYDQVRVMVDEVTVTTTDGTTASAKVPSGEFKMMGDVVVAEGETSSISLDFLADVSLHMTGKGEYIFAPVVHMENRSNAIVEVSANNTVTIEGGAISSNETHGMDASGEVRQDFRLDTSAGVEIKDGKIETSSGAKVKVEGGVNINTNI
ncbi:MAG: DUF4382 domain-containing protein [Patescibacteria group bacterium]